MLRELLVPVSALQRVVCLGRRASYDLAHELGAERVGPRLLRIRLSRIRRRFGNQVAESVVAELDRATKGEG